MIRISRPKPFFPHLPSGAEPNQAQKQLHFILTWFCEASHQFVYTLYAISLLVVLFQLCNVSRSFAYTPGKTKRKHGLKKYKCLRITFQVYYTPKLT